MAIIDLDRVDSKKTLQDYMSGNPDKPVLAISVNAQSIEGVRLLKKPIKLHELELSIQAVSESLAETRCKR